MAFSEQYILLMFYTSILQFYTNILVLVPLMISKMISLLVRNRVAEISLKKCIHILGNLLKDTSPFFNKIF